MDKTPIIIDGIFNASPEKVWKAITDKNEMKKWYFNLPDFKPEVGVEFRFTGGPSPEKQYLHICKITEVIVNKKLSHTWRYDEYAGESIVTFEIFPEGDQTKLKLTHSGIETFPADNEDLAKENFVEGWTQIIGTSLKEYFEK